MRSWKLSRSRLLSASATIEIDNVANTIDVLDDRYFNIRDHSAQACFYYPVPEPGRPVNFRGRCDDNLPVVQDFDVNRVSIKVSYNVALCKGNKLQEITDSDNSNIHA